MFMKRGVSNQEACGRKETLAMEPQNRGEERAGGACLSVRGSLGGVPVATGASGLK